MMTSTAPIKVCLVTQRWAPSFSGAANRFCQYIPGLRARGIEVDVLCTTAPSDESARSAAQWRELGLGEVMPADEVDGTQVHRLKLPPRRSLRRNRLFCEALVRHIGVSRSDVAQFLTLEPLRTLRRSGVSRSGVASVFTGTLMSDFSTNPVKRAFQRKWLRAPIQTMDRMVVSSEVMRCYYESLGVTIPMNVVPNGVDLRRFRAADRSGQRAAREHLGLSATAEVIVFVGSIIHRKGVDVLLRAFSRVATSNSKAELILVGPRSNAGSEDGRSFDGQIESIVRGSGVGTRIHFIGQVPSADVYLRAADVFVLPSRREGMGNVVLEAMATGVPTVLTPYLGLPAEFGEPGRQYVLSAPDADSLAEHISALLSNRDLRETVGREGRRWVEERMDISISIDAYAKIYRDLATPLRAGAQNQGL